MATVDKYQGQQNQYVLLSLVRTRAVGHLRDVRRLVVAMSRARLGLYVFGRASLFASCYELQPTFQCAARSGQPDCISAKYPQVRIRLWFLTSGTLSALGSRTAFLDYPLGVLHGATNGCAECAGTCWRGRRNWRCTPRARPSTAAPGRWTR